MATSKSMMTVGLVVMLVIGFVAGLFSSPAIMPQTNPQPTATPTPTPTSADPIWDSIKASGKIRIGTDPSWPPFESLDNSGKIIGFEVDLANAMASKLGLTTEWRSVGFDTIIASVQTKTLDLGVSGFSITAKRLDEVQFTMPHTLTRGQVIMLQSRKEALKIDVLTSLTQLKTLGLTVGTQTGTTEQDELTTAGVNLRQFTDFGLAIQDMTSANPSVDCVYAETPITTAWITQYKAQGKNIAVIYDIPYYPCAFLANKDANVFVTKLNGVLAEMIASGEFDQIKAKWGI
jgi:ABC-type amino acid transport substrate-binding protein